MSTRDEELRLEALRLAVAFWATPGLTVYAGTVVDQAEAFHRFLSEGTDQDARAVNPGSDA